MKKVLSILLALSMLLSLCTFSVSASATSAGPTEVTIHTGANQVILSWRNPVYTDNALTALKVYNGNGAVLSENFDLTSGKVQKYTHTGLTTSAVYNYKLEATFADGSKSTTKLSTKTAAPAKTNWMGGDGVQYKILYSTGVGNSAVFAGFDNNELKSGYPSMLLSNHTGTTLHSTDFIKFNLEGLTANTEYRLSFEYKAASGATPALLMNGKDAKYISCNGNWQAGSWDFTPTGTTYPIYFYMRNAENVWIANIALVVKGTTKSLIPEANPATIYSNASKKASITASEITNTAGINSITTTWNSSASYFNALKFYIKKSGETAYTYAGETANQKSGSFVFENLAPGTEYTVKTARVINGAEYAVKEENVSIAYPVIPTAQVSELTLHTGANQVIVSWRNPVHNPGNALTAIKVYDGNGTVLSDSFDLTSNKVQYYTHTGLTTGAVYNYKVETTFADGTKYSTKLSTKTAAPAITNWMGGEGVQYKIYYGSGVGTSAVFAGFDNNEIQNGYPSMIFSNHTGTQLHTTDFIRFNLENLTPGTKYKLGFSYKSAVGTAPALLMPDNSVKYISCNGNWVYGSWEFTPTVSNNTIYFYLRNVENIWIANLGLYADGSNTNLIPQANPATIYDNASKKESIKASEITNTAGADNITTTWNSSADNFNALKFYIKKSGETAYTYAGETANQKSGSFVFEGLELGQAYTVKTARVINGAEYDVKEETITTAEPVLEDWTISDYSFKLGESEVNEVTSVGTYKAAVTVTNNNSTDAVNAQLIAAVYNAGVLVNVFKSEAVSVKIGRSSEATVNIDVTDASYDVKLYVWNSLEGMKPLKKASKLY